MENALGGGPLGGMALESAVLERPVQEFYSEVGGSKNFFEFNKYLCFDFVLALLILIFLLPLMLVIASIIYLFDKGPVIYAHRRVGYGGETFSCLKFRTMAVDSQVRLRRHLDADPEARAEWLKTRKLRSDPRVTPFGRILRRSSLDEIPQLINVLLGDMSVVGPRPVVADEVLMYGPGARYYLKVKPGMTGLWQISGRSNLSFRRRVAMDVIYVRRKRLLWDLKILVLTVPVVLMARGSY